MVTRLSDTLLQDRLGPKPTEALRKEGLQLEKPYSEIADRLIAQHGSALGFGESPRTVAIPLQRHDGLYSTVVKVELLSDFARWRGFIKVARDGHEPGDSSLGSAAQREFEMLTRLWEVFADHPQLGVPKAIAHYPEFSAVVTEDVGGQSLDSELRQRANFYAGHDAIAWAEAVCRMCGQWLSRFHAATPADSKVKFQLSTMRDYIDERLQRLTDGGFVGANSDLRSRALGFFDLTAPEVSDESLAVVGIHGDFSMGNVIVVDGGVAVLDFSDCNTGSALHDVSHFYQQLFNLRLNPRYRSRLARRLSEVFLKAYDPQFDNNAPLFHLFQLQHAICLLLEVRKTRANSVIDALHRRYLVRKHLRYIQACCRATHR